MRDQVPHPHKTTGKGEGNITYHFLEAQTSSSKFEGQTGWACVVSFSNSSTQYAHPLASYDNVSKYM